MLWLRGMAICWPWRRCSIPHYHTDNLALSVARKSYHDYAKYAARPYIANVHGNQTERVATEALLYLLKQSEAARRQLEGLTASGVEVSVEPIMRLQNRGCGQEAKGRADLGLLTIGRTRERVLVEVKFWAGSDRSISPIPTWLGWKQDTPSVLAVCVRRKRSASSSSGRSFAGWRTEQFGAH